jgi:hypothetical protein
MGRTLKRVPLDFDWPLNKLWPGFVNDLGGPCPEEGKTCFGGYTAAGKWLESVARLISMLGEQASETPEQRARPGLIFPHPYLQEWGQAPRTEVPREIYAEIRKHDDSATRRSLLAHYLRANPSQLLPLTADLHQLVEGLAGRKVDSFGGSCVSWAIAKKLTDAAGMPEKWGECPVCEGHADDPKLRAEAEAWEPTEPPIGEGFQLWETTSEGSPASPVFATIEALCDWCADNATTFGSFKASAERWREMLDANFVRHEEGNMVFL